MDYLFCWGDLTAWLEFRLDFLASEGLILSMSRKNEVRAKIADSPMIRGHLLGCGLNLFSSCNSVELFKCSMSSAHWVVGYLYLVFSKCELVA